MSAGRRITVEFLGADKSLSRTVDGVEQSTATLSGKFSGLGKAAKIGFASVATAAAGATAAITASIATALGQEKSSDRLAASLGATPAVAEKYGKIAGNLYAGAWGESMDDVNHAIESVASSFKGLSGAGLEKVTIQAMDFASIFETDLPRATAIASTVMKSGLAKSATEAFDLMTAASQRVPAALREDIGDAAEEYGQFFKSLGFSGEEAFGVLVKGAEKGQYGIDKAGDAIKEFTIRATDMSTSTKDAYKSIGVDAGRVTSLLLNGGDGAKVAFKAILDGLVNIKDPAKQAQQAIALFGTPLEDLNATEIPAFLKSLKSGTKGMKDWKGSIDEAGATLNDNAATNLESFKRQVTQGFVNLIGGKALPVIREFSARLAKDVGPTLRRLGAWIKTDVVPALREFAAWLGEKIPPIFAVIKSVVADFTTDGSSKLSKFFTDMKALFLDGVTIVTRLWDLFGKNIVGFLKGWVSSIITIVKGVFQVIKGIFQVFAGVLTGDWRKVWTGLKNIFGGFVKIFIGMVKNLWNTVKFAFKNAGVVLKNLAAKLWEAIKALTKKGVTALIDLVKSVPGRIKAMAGLYLAAGKWVISKMWEGIKAITRNGAQWLRDEIAKIPGKIKSLAGKFKEAGGALITAIANGIKNAAGFATDFAGQIWQAVKSAINSGIDQLNNMLEFSFKVKGVGISVDAPDIGHLAKGTDNWRGGLAVVGEQGPELVDLPRGAKVTPHGESMGRLRGLGGGDDRPILVQLVLDSKVIEQALIRRTRDTGRPLQVKTL